jgi:hypothetical protein
MAVLRFPNVLQVHVLLAGVRKSEILGDETWLWPGVPFVLVAFSTGVVKVGIVRCQLRKF